MKKSIIVFIILLTSQLNYAQEVYRDSLVIWFSDPCNRPAQVQAFLALKDKYSGVGVRPFEMIAPRQTYDTPEIKDAFEFFLRSVTIDPPDCGENYIGDPALGDGEVDLEQDNIQLMMLSLAITWGITEDIYEIADNIYWGSWGRNFHFGAFVVHHLGPGYLEYGLTKIQQDTSYIHAPAFLYLEFYPNPSPEMLSSALSVINARVESPSADIRLRSLRGLFSVYEKGYEQVGPLIEALLNDENERVRAAARRAVAQEHRSNRLLEFQWEEEPVEE